MTDATAHDSSVVKKGGNDGDRTSGDCISRQAALETIRTMQTYKLFAGDDMLLIDQAGAQTELMMLPSAKPVHKTGRWTIKNGELAFWDVCSECKKMVMHKAPFYNYCPNCGADMRGDKHEID